MVYVWSSGWTGSLPQVDIMSLGSDPSTLPRPMSMAGLRIFAAFIQRVCMQVPEVDPGLLYCPINQLPVSGVRKVGDLVLVAAAFLHHVALQGTDDENLLPLAALKMGIAALNNYFTCFESTISSFPGMR